MNLRLNPPRAAQAVRVRAPRRYPMASLLPRAPVGFWRWALGNLICWGAVFVWLLAVVLWFAALTN